MGYNILMFDHIEMTLLSFADRMPLELFVPLASIVEEVLAPIPSPTVMVFAGGVASLQGKGVLTLVLLTLLGALGKLIGALIVYVIADKAEDVVIGKFGRYFNVTPGDIEAFREKLGTGKKAYVTLTLLRALPFVPSSIVSVGSGVIRVPMRIYIVSTFLGTILRDGFYLIAGYVGARSLASVIAYSGELEHVIEIVIVIVILAFIAWRIAHRRSKM